MPSTARGLDENRLHRFGQVPTHVAERIAQATDAELRSWLARTFTAATVDQVFA